MHDTRLDRIPSTRLLVVAELSDDLQHLFERNEAATMLQLVAVDRLSQLLGFCRQAIVAIGELSTLASCGAVARTATAAINKRLVASERNLLKRGF